MKAMIYLDANIFVYAVLDDGKKGEFCKKLLEKVAFKQINAFTSVLTWDEVIYSLKKHVPIDELMRQSKEFFKFPNLVFLDANFKILKKAEEILFKYNLGPRDAIHVATALNNGVLQIASDDSDFNKVKEIKRIF